MGGVVIAAAWIMLAALVAAGLARESRRRRLMLHTLVMAVCGLLLAVCAVFVGFGGVIADLPTWANAVGVTIDVFLVAVMVDLARAKKHDEAAR